MSIPKYVISLLGLIAIATFAVSVLLASCSLLSLPYGEATVAATATISIDDKRYTGSSIWRVKAQTQNGWPDSGINYRRWVLGDAIEFKIDDGTYAFLRPQTGVVMRCARQEHPKIEYLAQALSMFEGPCVAERSGLLTFVALSLDGIPNFTNFAIDPDGQLHNDGGGKELSPEILAIADRGFALISQTLIATNEPLRDGMVERFPWILNLPRADVWQGRKLGEGYGRWSRGQTYMQYFTTDLPP